MSSPKISANSIKEGWVDELHQLEAEWLTETRYPVQGPINKFLKLHGNTK